MGHRDPPKVMILRSRLMRMEVKNKSYNTKANE